MRDFYMAGAGGTRQGARSKKNSELQASGGYSIEASYERNMPVSSSSAVANNPRRQPKSRTSGIVNIVSRDNLTSSQQTFMKNLAQRQDLINNVLLGNLFSGREAGARNVNRQISQT